MAIFLAGAKSALAQIRRLTMYDIIHRKTPHVRLLHVKLVTHRYWINLPQHTVCQETSRIA